MEVTRYHPVLVILHWVLAFLIIGALCLGFFVLSMMPNDDPQKIDVLRYHIVGGLLIFALMIVRFVVRASTIRPTMPTANNPVADRIAPVNHYGLYFLVLLMIITGIATALITDLPAIVFGGSGDPLPARFDKYPTFVAHASIAILLAGMIALHIAAAFYHQFVLKDGLFRRMGFGNREAEPSPDV